MASDNEIYVNYGQVTDVYDALVDADKSIQMVLNELENVINPLRQTWSGASESEYTAVQARWNQDTADMSLLLQRYQSTLDEISINYSNTDGNLAMQWSEIN